MPAMPARKLRAVAPDEAPPAPKKPKTVTEAAASGTPRELLVAMRDRVALAVEDRNTAARDLAALTKRLREITLDIEAVDARAAQEQGADGAGEVGDGVFDASAV